MSYLLYGFMSGGSNSPSSIRVMNKRVAQSFIASSETKPYADVLQTVR